MKFLIFMLMFSTVYVQEIIRDEPDKSINTSNNGVINLQKTSNKQLANQLDTTSDLKPTENTATTQAPTFAKDLSENDDLKASASSETSSRLSLKKDKSRSDMKRDAQVDSYSLTKLDDKNVYKKNASIKEDHTKPVIVQNEKGYIYLLPSASSTNLPNLIILFVCLMFTFFL